MKAITDKPIVSCGDDLLKIEKYSQGLCNFIDSSDTPITIGLQGEWGTGKTSLMQMMLEKLKDQKIATSWVNTWEYSLFSGVAETTPKVLQGMLEKLEDSCVAAGNWDIGDETTKKLRGATRFIGAIANQIAKQKFGVDVQDAHNEVNGALTAPRLSAIAAIKSDISDVIKKLIDSKGNPYKKVVFFVDDLDRINPSDAVEVLESLKNIFDMEHCVFILAIDYDIVVKGLESKFGKKTHENEREFRSFFDKIIQVPFTMPIGTYDIENFLRVKFSQVDISIQDGMEEKYARVVRHTVGFNPRSLKRYLNSFSLINNVRSLEEGSEGHEASHDFILFALLGVQVSFPQVFRLLTQDSDYIHWTKEFASKQDLVWEDLLSQLSIFGETELLDEDWEKIVWGVCQKDPYLKSKSFDILMLLNLLREQYGESLLEIIDSVMEFAAITNVDDDIESRQATQKGKWVSFDSLALKIAQLKEIGCGPEAIDAYTKILSPLLEAAKEFGHFKVNLAKTAVSLSDARVSGSAKAVMYIENLGKKAMHPKIVIAVSSGLTEELHQYILDQNPSVSEKHVVIDKNHALILATSLAANIGKDKYDELIAYILSRLLRQS